MRILTLVSLAPPAFAIFGSSSTTTSPKTTTSEDSCPVCLVTNAPVVTWTSKPCKYDETTTVEVANLPAQSAPLFCRMATAMPYCIMLSGYEIAATMWLESGCPGENIAIETGTGGPSLTASPTASHTSHAFFNHSGW